MQRPAVGDNGRRPEPFSILGRIGGDATTDSPQRTVRVG